MDYGLFLFISINMPISFISVSQRCGLKLRLCESSFFLLEIVYRVAIMPNNISEASSKSCGYSI